MHSKNLISIAKIAFSICSVSCKGSIADIPTLATVPILTTSAPLPALLTKVDLVPYLQECTILPMCFNGLKRTYPFHLQQEIFHNMK